MAKCKRCSGTGKEIDHVQIGLTVRHSRTAVGMTLRELARRLEISAPYLSDLERGRRNWSDSRLDDAMEKILTYEKSGIY